LYLKYKFYYHIFFSLSLSIFVSWINFYNRHGDIIYFNNLYNSLYNTSLQHFFGFDETGKGLHTYNGEILFKLIFWVSANLFIPKIILNLIFNFFLFYFIFYVNYLKKINIFITILALCTSFYLWNIIFSSDKNVIALVFFLLSIIYFLKNKKYFFILFYSICIFVASGYIILYCFFFLLNLDKKKFFFNKKIFITTILLIIPVFFSYKIMLARFTGYNVVYQNADQQSKQLKINQEQLKINQEQLKINQEKNYLNKKLNFIKKILDNHYEIKLFKYNLNIPYYMIDIKEKDLYLTYKVSEICKIIFFITFFFIFFKNKLNVLFSALTIFFISGLISFEKITYFLYVVFLTTLLLNHFKNKKYSKTQIYSLFSFFLFLTFKQFVMFYNLYIYNVPYVY
jgi:hypothetical protein